MNTSTHPGGDNLFCGFPMRERENKELLSKLTVVIPSYERQDYLLRQLMYWSVTQAKVVVVDGSERSLNSQVQQYLGTNTNIKYLHLPIDVASRLKAATPYLHTDYAVLLGDDEFFLKSGLTQAISKLEHRPDLIACIGQSLGFHFSRKLRKCTYDRGYPHWRFEVVAEDVRQRLHMAMSNYNAANCYAVYRTPAWIKTYGNLQNWSSIYAVEMQQAISTYIHGKLSTVDEIYWLRSSENAPINSRASNRRLLFYEWWMSPTYQAERERFVNLLAADVVESHKVGSEDAKGIVLSAVSEFNEFLRKREQSRNRNRGAHAVLRSALRDYAGRVMDFVLSPKQAQSLRSRISRSGIRETRGQLGTLDELVSSQTQNGFHVNAVSAKELMDIEQLIRQFYAGRETSELV